MSSPQTPDYDFDLASVAAALMRERGIKSGLWRLAAKMRFAALTLSLGDGAKAPTPMPTGTVSLDGLALFKADRPGDLVYDAADVLAPKSDQARPRAKVTRKVAAKKRSG